MKRILEEVPERVCVCVSCEPNRSRGHKLINKAIFIG